MPSGYPSSLDSLQTTFADNDVIPSGDHNDGNDATNKIEAELGTDPSGTYSTVKARLDAFDAPTINAQTGTTYTLVLSDLSKIVSISNAGAITLTVPPNSSVAFPVGAGIPVRQAGAGQITVAPGSGVTINSRGAALKLAGQYAWATLIKVATDTWDLIGDITT